MNTKIKLAVALVGAAGLAGLAYAQEVKTVEKGIEIQYTTSILAADKPVQSEAKCADATPGYSIVPDSVKTTVAEFGLTDPGGNMDEKPNKMEGITTLSNNNTKICMVTSCEAPVAYQCMLRVQASWQEKK